MGTVAPLTAGAGPAGPHPGRGWLPLALLAALALVALAAARLVAVRRALARRRGFVVLPTDTFDATPEAIAGYAHMLAATRKAVGGWLARPATAIRVALESTSDGRLLYRVEGPAHAVPVLRMPGYQEVELRPLDDPDVAALRGQEEVAPDA